ncbi:MAG: hypothetical protein Q4F83_13195 [Eubacteriales bacterium]|nr:hypothetical protein [Eubacteriales bacterium]
MKTIKRVTGTIVFLGIAAALLIASSYLVRPVTEGFLLGRMAGFYSEEENSIDVTFYGSSALYRFINVTQLWDEYGFTSYNLSTPSQPISAVKYLMEEADREQSPQLYVVECRRFLGNGTGLKEKNVRWVTDNMPYSINRFEAVSEMTANKEKKLSYYFDLVKYHDNWEDIGVMSLNRLTNNLTWDRKGWAEQNDVAEGQEAPNIIGEDETVPITEYAEEQLRELIEECKEEGREVLFLATPFKIKKESQGNYNYIRGIVEESGYQFLDCNRYIEEIGLDYSRDFYDTRHTNSLGAQKVTKFVGKYIMDHYSIDTEYNAEVTADWNAAAQKGRETFEEAKEEILIKAGEE